MKLKILYLILISFCSVVYSQTNINEKTLIKGLTEVSLNSLTSEQQKNLDITKVPIYSDQGKTLSITEFQELVQSGTNLPHLYADTDNNIKVIIVKPATQEEFQALIAAATNNTDDNSLLGSNALDFSFSDLEGNTYTLKNLKGKIIVINFWFVECKPCIEEIPELNELVEKYKNNEDIVFLAITFDGSNKVKKFKEKVVFDYALIPDARETISNYGINSYPTHILIDTNQKIDFFTQGLNRFTVKNLEKRISKLTQ